MSGPYSTCYDRHTRCRGLFGEGPALTGTPKAQVSARKRSGNRTADLRHYVEWTGVSSELWRVVPFNLRGAHRRGAAPTRRLISQVQGQMGGTCTGNDRQCCHFVLEDLWDEKHLFSSCIRN